MSEKVYSDQYMRIVASTEYPMKYTKDTVIKLDRISAFQRMQNGLAILVDSQWFYTTDEDGIRLIDVLNINPDHHI